MVNRNGGEHPLVSVLQVGKDTIRARVWNGPSVPDDCQRISFIGSGIEVSTIQRDRPKAFLDRQALAFGEDVNAALRDLTEWDWAFRSLQSGVG